MQLKEVLEEYVEKYKDKFNASEIARIFYNKEKDKLKLKGQLESYRRIISRILENKRAIANSKVEDSIYDILKQYDEHTKQILQLLMQKPYRIEHLATKMNLSEDYIRYIIERIKKEHYNLVERHDDEYYLDKTSKIGGKLIKIESLYKNKFKFGVVSDNHLNSIHERLDVLNALYDIFEKEGIEIVLNAGNWIDGEAKFNRYEIKNRGIDRQIGYFVDNYPQRKGMVTKFIAGDDHEGWYWQREGVNIGEYAQMRAEKIGRTDLEYIGYVESDVVLQLPQGKTTIKVMHPGGGTAYALSYTPQKIIESFQGGEKPNILILGHYHKAEYIIYRDVHTIQAGCTQDQTTFMRKKRIAAHLGGWIIEFSTSNDGAVHEFKPSFYSFFNQSYYERMQYYTQQNKRGK